MISTEKYNISSVESFMQYLSICNNYTFCRAGSNVFVLKLAAGMRAAEYTVEYVIFDTFRFTPIICNRYMMQYFSTHLRQFHSNIFISLFQMI